MPEPVLLLGAGTAAAGGEFNLAQIAAAHPVTLVDAAAPAWARPHLVRHIAADPGQWAATVVAVNGHVSRHEVRGVLSWMPEHLVTASRIAGALGLPAAPVPALAVLDDLAALRRLLAQHNVPQPRWAQSPEAASAAVHADRIGYPVLVGPRAGREAGAVLAYNRADVSAACRRPAHDPSPGVLGHSGQVVVEEHLDGPALSAEVVVLHDGEIRIVAVARTSSASTPGQGALRHCVYAHDGLLHNPILRQTVTRAVCAVGIAPAVLHISMRVTPKGPRIIDVQGHLANDLIPLLVRRATGVDLPRIAAQLAVGATPDLTPSRQRAAAVQFAYAPVSGRVERLAVSPRAASQPCLERMVLLQQAGNLVTSMAGARARDRLAYWVALGNDARSCYAVLDEAARLFSADITETGAAANLAATC